MISTATTSIDIAQGVRFLDTLFAPGDYITIRPIESWVTDNRKDGRVDHKGIKHFLVGARGDNGVWHPQDSEQMTNRLKWVAERAERERTNIYFGTCPRIGGNSEYDHAFQIRTVRAIWADVDDTADASVVQERCRKVGLPEPSVIIHSGHGIHIYWLLDEPYLIDDAGPPPPVKKEWTEKNGKRKPRKFYVDADGDKHYLDKKSDEPLSDKSQAITDILQGVAVAIGGDHTFDLARVLRVPGLLNRKNERNGQEPVPCVMLKCEPAERHPLSAFASFAAKSPAKTERKAVAKVKLPATRKLTPGKADKLNELVTICAAAPVGDRSEADFSLCCFAVERGVARDEVWSRVQGVGKFGERGERYFDATWAKAEGHTRLKIWEKAKRKTTEGKTLGDRKTTCSDDPEPGQKVILIGPDESRVVNSAIEALSGLGRIYQRSGKLVHIVVNAPPPPCIGRADDAPRIVMMLGPRLREYLADAAVWVNPDSEEPAHPPEWVVRAIDARQEWPGIPPIEAVIECPVVRQDGSVVETAGYDAASGLFYRPAIDFPAIPKNPTQDDARTAADRLIEVVEDFPFSSSFHRSAWLSAVLTPLARYAFHGPAPLHLIDSNTRGTGKGLLSDTVGLIVQGRTTPRMPATSCDEEFRKRVTAIALAAEPIILLDNLGDALGCPSLDAALTATTWSDRVLGRSELVFVPLTATWLATGNNVQLQADTARRVLHIRLETNEERPEERTGFRHPELGKWVLKERPRLVSAALTILSAYCSAGRPRMGLKPWGSFEGWSDLVRSAITWAGLDDPGETRTELNATSDNEGNILRRLIDGWSRLDADGCGMLVGEVLESIAYHERQAATLSVGLQLVRDAIVELAPMRGNVLPSARSVGGKLKKFRRRVVGGRFLDFRDSSQGNLWFVKQVG